MADAFEDLPDTSGPTFVAEYDSPCNRCSAMIWEGQLAQYVDNLIVHVNCPPPPPKRAACPKCWLVHGTHQEDCDG